MVLHSLTTGLQQPTFPLPLTFADKIQHSDGTYPHKLSSEHNHRSEAPLEPLRDRNLERCAPCTPYSPALASKYSTMKASSSKLICRCPRSTGWPLTLTTG
ncbi:MAG: hypothetical protein KME23_01055 [Goleter apudmare HA4340-LM2]|nr:hypothetical protein [Goleter apudmare HA4340-LM2]